MTSYAIKPARRVTPCPKDCPFDWVDFHRKLDGAVAHMISESSYPDICLPTEVSVMDLMEYASQKKNLRESKTYK